jgi:hypothetical protein
LEWESELEYYGSLGKTSAFDINELPLEEEHSIDEMIDRQRAWAKLSAEAKEMVRVIVESPAEILGATGDISVKVIYDYFRAKKWKYKTIYKAINEIRKLVQVPEAPGRGTGMSWRFLMRGQKPPSS